MNRDAKIACFARRQHGLISHGQAMACGLTDRMIDVRLTSGRWDTIRRGVYVVAGAPVSERQSVLAVCLATGAMASHLTAARLWGFDLPAPDAIHIVGARHRLDGVRSHQSATIVAADRAQLCAVELTASPRTLVDCAGSVSLDRLGAVVDDGLRRGLVKLAALRACHERIDTGPGRRATLAMREVLAARMGDYSAGDSTREAELLKVLAAGGLPAPVLGHRVRIGGSSYKLDVSWPEFLVGLEFDSWEFHRSYTSFHGDRQRMRRLVAAGWTILPVTSKTNLRELVGDVAGLLGFTWRASIA